MKSRVLNFSLVGALASLLLGMPPGAAASTPECLLLVDDVNDPTPVLAKVRRSSTRVFVGQYPYHIATINRGGETWQELRRGFASGSSCSPDRTTNTFYLAEDALAVGCEDVTSVTFDDLRGATLEEIDNCNFAQCGVTATSISVSIVDGEFEWSIPGGYYGCGFGNPLIETVIQQGRNGATKTLTLTSNGRQSSVVVARVSAFLAHGDCDTQCTTPVLGACILPDGCCIPAIAEDECPGSWTPNVGCGMAILCEDLPDIPPPPPPPSPNSPPAEGDTTPDGSNGCDGEDEPGDGRPTAYHADEEMAAQPVEHFSGHKVMTETDFTLPLIGTDFSYTRYYRGSQARINQGSLIGTGWSGSAHSALEITTPGGGDPVLTLYAENLKWTYTKHPTEDRWEGTGPTAQYFEKAIVDDDPDTTDIEGYAVWRLVNPGKWQIEYFRTPDSGELDESFNDSDLEGLPYRRYDAHNNRWTYSYVKYGSGNARLSGIACDRNDAWSGWSLDASIAFFWDTNPYSPNAGQLDEIIAYKADSTGSLKVAHRVSYTYVGDLGYDPAIWPSLGTTGDLIQVEVATRLDDAGIDDPVFHSKFTQYRYHTGDSEGTTPDTTVDTNGNGIPGEKGVAGQLRMVFTPANIEYFAEHHGSNDLTLAEAADAMLALADDDTAFTGTTIAALASKIVARYDGDRVEVQYLQASCGCLSSSVGRLGIRRIYDYWMDAGTLELSDNFSFWHTEASYDDSISSWVDYRTYVSHHTRHATTDIPLKVGEAIIEEASPNREWAKKYLYTSTNAELQVVAHRSAIDYSTYDANIDSTPGMWTLETLPSAGLVQGYTYDSNSRVTSSLVKAGFDETAGFNASNFDLIEEIEYYTATGEEHLVKERRRFRTYTGSTAADDVEVTQYEYGFYEEDPGNGIEDPAFQDVHPMLAWKKNRVEQEISTENGPGTSGQNQFYETTQVYDRYGRMRLVRAADNVVTEYEYDSVTGALSSITQNRQNGQIVFDSTTYGEDVGNLVFPTGITLSAWGLSDGLVQTATFTNDILGRRLIATGPASRSYSVFRTVAAAPSRLNSNLGYYSTITLPHIIDGSASEYNGMAMQQWADAAGQSVETIGYVLGSTTDTGESYRTSAASLVGSLSAATRSASDFDWSGNAVQQRVWHDADVAGAYYETEGFFDEFGRLERITDDNGNHTVYTYDVLDRQIKVQTGVSLGNLFDVSESVYDNGVAGDSNMTLVRQHVTTSSDRETEFRYDDRNRLVWTINELAPHGYAVYDNLNRMIESHASSTAPTAIEAPAQSNRIASSYQDYSQRGLVWRGAREIDPTTAPDTDVLLSEQWFDEVGRTIKSQPPGAPGTKMAYDGLGRVTHTFVGEMLGDSGYTDVYDATNRKPKVNGDVILEESVTIYGTDEDQRGFGRPVLTTNYQRAHTSSSTGSLSNYDSGGGDSTAVATFSGYIYDDANRPVQSGSFGTNQSSGFDAGGTAPIMQAGDNSNDFGATNLLSMPADALIGESIYDGRGRVETTVQPDGTRTRTIFDDMNRAIGVIENDQTSSVVSLVWSTNRWATTNAGGGSNPDDQNRVTSFVYDGLSNITRRVAHDGDANIQETLYTYAYDGTHIKSNALLSKVEYPDESAGTANAMDDEYEVSYEYNAQGELIEMTDQNGTVHAYGYDEMGRLTEDDVTLFGTNIDQTVHTIKYAFSSTTGLLEEVTSLDGGGTPNILNQIRFEYDDMLALSKYRQNPSGEVNTGGQSADVEYIYAREDGTTGDNFSRLNIMKYPFVNTGGKQRTQLQQYYGAAASLDDKISRSRGFDWDFQMVAAAFNEIRYDYVGLGMTVVASHGSSKLQLDRYVDPNYMVYFGGGGGVVDSRTPGDYESLDQYGRVERQVWVENPATWDPGAKPAVFDVKFEYEIDATDILRRYDAREGTSLADIGDKYAYDDLNRLDEAIRGKPDGAGWTADGSREETWGLDVFGNWDTYANAIGGTSFSQNRTHNQANELTLNEQTVGMTTTDLDMTYDDAGNLRTREVSDTVRWVYTWDAWNRLVAVDIEVDTGLGWVQDAERMASGYYGLNQRAWSQIDAGAAGYANNGVPTEALDRLEHFYYDASWRLLERRVDTNWPGSGFTHDQTTQWVWGHRYIDELIAWADDTKALSSTFDSTTFAMTDRNFSVIGLNNGERVRYDAYGYALASPYGDVDADGLVGLSDSNAVSAAFGTSYGGGSYAVEADVNRDGSVNLTDLNVVTGASGDSIDRGDLSESGNIVGYAGYIFEPATGMYVVRHRWHSPMDGRWLSRDPLMYADGQLLYGYGLNSPVSTLDPLGLKSWLECCPSLADCLNDAAAAVAEHLSFLNNINKQSISMLGALEGVIDQLEPFIQAIAAQGAADATFRVILNQGGHPILVGGVNHVLLEHWIPRIEGQELGSRRVRDIESKRFQRDATLGRRNWLIRGNAAAALLNLAVGAGAEVVSRNTLIDFFDTVSDGWAILESYRLRNLEQALKSHEQGKELLAGEIQSLESREWSVPPGMTTEQFCDQLTSACRANLKQIHQVLADERRRFERFLEELSKFRDAVIPNAPVFAP